MEKIYENDRQDHIEINLESVIVSVSINYAIPFLVSHTIQKIYNIISKSIKAKNGWKINENDRQDHIEINLESGKSFYIYCSSCGSCDLV